MKITKRKMRPIHYSLICLLVVLIIVYICIPSTSTQAEYYQSFFQRPNIPIITTDYNPFPTITPPERLPYILNVPDRYKTNASRAWIAEAVDQCSRYNKGYVPTSVQDCPDSSFTYIDRPEYKGCIQLVQNTNYCMSDAYGNYVPNIDKLNVTAA